MESLLDAVLDYKDVLTNCPVCNELLEHETFSECVGENYLHMGVYEEQIKEKCKNCGYTSDWKTVGTHLGNWLFHSK